MLIFPSFYSLIIKNRPLESELGNFISEQTKNYPLFSKEFDSVENFENEISQSSMPSVLKEILLKKANQYAENLSANSIITCELYKLISILIIGIILFIIINLITSIVVDLIFKNIFLNKDMFVTKRFVSGILGGVKGFLLFFVITGVLLCFAESLNLTIVQEEIKNSPLYEVSGQIFSKYLISLGIWWQIFLDYIIIFVEIF